MELREALTFDGALPVPGAPEGVAGARALWERCGVTGFPVADDKLAARRNPADPVVPQARPPA